MRQRIVINLDAPGGSAPQRRQAAGATRRRWPRVLAILAGVVLVVVVVALIGGFIFWRYYQSTPTYAVTMMIYAAQRDDLTELQKRINDEEIARNMMPAISQKAADRYGSALNDSIKQQIQSVMPSLLPQLKQIIQAQVVREIKDFSSAEKPRSFLFLLFSVPYVAKVTTEGDTAKATATVTERAIELTMKRQENEWKVTEVKDDLLLQKVVESVMKDLPAIGSNDANSPLMKQFGRGKRARRRR